MSKQGRDSVDTRQKLCFGQEQVHCFSEIYCSCEIRVFIPLTKTVRGETIVKARLVIARYHCTVMVTERSGDPELTKQVKGDSKFCSGLSWCLYAHRFRLEEEDNDAEVQGDAAHRQRGQVDRHQMVEPHGQQV